MAHYPPVASLGSGAERSRLLPPPTSLDGGGAGVAWIGSLELTVVDSSGGGYNLVTTIRQGASERGVAARAPYNRYSDGIS